MVQMKSRLNLRHLELMIRFGHSVGAGSSKIVVGAPYDDPNGSQSGRAYILTKMELIKLH